MAKASAESDDSALIEGEDEGLIETEGLEQLELHRQRRQPEERLIGGEELARVRLEDDGAGAAALGLRDAFCLVENRLMAAVDTVEIADGQNRAFQSGRCVPPGADNVHRLILGLPPIGAAPGDRPSSPPHPPARSCR